MYVYASCCSIHKNTDSSIFLCTFKALVFSFLFTAIYTYINLVPSTARVFGDKGGLNDLDDVHLFEGEEMQWRILSAVNSCTTPFNALLYVAYT